MKKKAWIWLLATATWMQAKHIKFELSSLTWDSTKFNKIHCICQGHLQLVSPTILQCVCYYKSFLWAVLFLTTAFKRSSGLFCSMTWSSRPNTLLVISKIKSNSRSPERSDLKRFLGLYRTQLKNESAAPEALSRSLGYSWSHLEEVIMLSFRMNLTLVCTIRRYC